MKDELYFEFVDAKDCFDDDNEGMIYGINWLDENKNIIDCEWFKTEDERMNTINQEFGTQ